MRVPMEPLHVFLASVLLWVALQVSPASALTVSYRDGFPDPFIGGTYTGTRDTMILSNGGSHQDQNFGARTDFEVGTYSGPTTKRHDLVRFDITSLAGQFGAINSVTLRLFVTSEKAGTDTVQVFRLASANTGWVEGTQAAVVGPDPPDTGMSTWNRRVQGSQNWAGSQGASSAGTDYRTPLVASAAFNASSIAVDSPFDLVFTSGSFVPAWTTGANAGLFLRTVTESGDNRLSFHSRQSSTASLRPEQIIDYTPIGPEPATLWLLASGLLGVAPGAWRRRRRR